MSPEILARVSVEEFWRLGHGWPKTELVAGQVIETVPPGVRHAAVASTVVVRLSRHVADRRAGLVLTDAGFVLSADPPMVRAPDVAVVLAEDVPQPLPLGFFPGAPALAVEVLSPDDHPGEVAAKVADYLRAGTRAVWVLDPEARTVTVHAPGGAVRYSAGEILRGAPPLPGLEVPVGDLFP